MASRRSTKAADEQEPVVDPAAEAKNTGEPAPAEVTPDAKAHDPIETEHFVITRSGRGVVEVSQIGWVGPAQLTFHESKLDDFKKAVEKL